MPKTRPAYPAEFRWQMVDLVRAGRDPTDRAREFKPSGQTIRNWVAEVDRSESEAGARYPLSRDSLVRAGDRGPADGVFRFMSANQADVPITVMARTLGVSKAGYCAWAGRQPSARRVADAAC